jgi:hypothetical protein
MRVCFRLLVACLTVLVVAALTNTSTRAASARAASTRALVAEHVTRLEASGAVLPLRSVRNVDTGIDTELVGFDWDGSSQGEIQVRAMTSTGWSAWQIVDSDPALSPDVGSKEFRGRSSAGPIWLGHDVRQVQFQVTKGSLVNLRLHAIYSAPTPAATQPAAVASSAAVGQPAIYSAPTAAATQPASIVPSVGVGQPAIISRAQWGADESYRTFAPGCDGSVAYADNVHFLVVHHTDNGNSYGPGDSAAIIRGIYYFHTHTNLWCDIGYNFIVDQYGQIFEGRYGGITRPVIGAHAGAFNTGSSGIALLGTFTAAAPSAAMFSALRRLAGWEATIHGINPSGTVTVRAGSFAEARWPAGTHVTLPTIIGHRDVDFTDCPGNAAYAELPALRADVTSDVGAAWARSWSLFQQVRSPATPAIAGAPAVSSWGVDRFDVFVRGGDNQLYHRWSVDGGATFSRWESLGAPPGGLSSSPAAVSWGYARIDVFVRGGDSRLWHKGWAGTWSGWENLGGVLTSAPTVSSWSAGRLDVFADGGGRVVYHKWYQARWSGWESLGGVGAYDPASTSWGPGRIDLFTVGTDGGLWHKWYAGGWSLWREDVSSRFASGVGAASWGPGRLDVFAAANTATKPMTHVFFTNGWGVESLGGSLTSAPSAVSWLYNRLDVFVRGTDGNIWHNRYPGS